MHHGPELTVVEIVCLVLAVGAATRMFAYRTRLPYTIAMMLIGVATGLVLKSLGVDSASPLIEHLSGGGGVSADLIIFVFLPALVFESAYSLDVHAFLKNLSVVAVLAVPALVLATVLTALLMVAVTASSWAWSLPLALVFGALISATDPVAVVAVLKEAGAPKKLAVLIEGESLLNDGTAIVVFSVLLALVTSAATFDGGATALRFLWVVAGGVGVGVGLAMITSVWVSRTFDDPLVEITLTVVLAYGSMVLAEAVLHVSGVLAVVSAGLFMKGPGRTRISPEVVGFLHHFWDLLAYLANTLIFYLVGLLIAAHLEEATWTTAACIGAAYLGVMVIRFGVTFGSMPFIARLGDGVSTSAATVLSWGGLRGAVSLALALVVSQQETLDAIYRMQLLQVTAGVVLLTIVVNGSSTGWLLRRLGFDKMPVSERLALLRAKEAALVDIAESVAQTGRNADLRTLQWAEVRGDLEARRMALKEELRQVQETFGASALSERAGGLWRYAISVERKAYRAAFAEGTLGGAASSILEHELDLHYDRLERGDVTPPESRAPNVGGIRAWLGRALRVVGLAGVGFEADRLALLYDLSRGERRAAEDVQRSIRKFRGVEPDTVETIERTYGSYERAATERIEDMRVNLSEITTAIEMRLAERIALNFERSAFAKIVARGELTPRAAEEVTSSVRQRMKRLHFRPKRMQIAETADLCRETAMFRDLPEETVQELAQMTKERAFQAGEHLFAEGDKADSMFIIARGAVHVLRESDGDERILGVLGGGDLLGEMGLLTHERRNATARASTLVTVGQISRSDFERLMKSYPEVRENIWRTFARRLLDDLLALEPELGALSAADRDQWLAEGEHLEIPQGAMLGVGDAAWAFLVRGELDEPGPYLRRATEATPIAKSAVRIVLLGPPPETL